MNQPFAKPLRLLFVTPRYFPFLGGVENHVREVATRLLARGVDVTVLTTDPSGRLPAEDNDSGIPIWRLPALPADSDYYFAPGILSSVAHGRWDIVHCQSYHTFVPPLAMLGALRAGLPYVVTFHGGGHSSRLRNAVRGIQREMLRPLLARADRLVAVAEFEIDFFSRRLRIPAKRFALIPNGANLGNVAPTASTSHQGTRLISVGRLEEYKGHQRVIAALPHLIEQYPDIQLRIVGSGAYEPELWRLAGELDVAQRVEIGAIPSTDRDAMASLMHGSDLLVLLSEYETHPLSVIEALALGKPALVAATSGLTELAERGLVRAIPLRSSPTRTAAAIADQLENPLLPPDITFPSWDDCADDLHTLYQDVLDRRRAT